MPPRAGPGSSVCRARAKPLAKLCNSMHLSEPHPLLKVEFQVEIVQGILCLGEQVWDKHDIVRGLGHYMVEAHVVLGFA